MLTRLLPDQISKFWDVIKYAIEESAPPNINISPDMMNKILMSLLSNKSQCWVMYTVKENKRDLNAVAVTEISIDNISECKNLLLYSVYGYTNISRKSWLSAFKVLAKYAIANNCDKIVGYTNVPHILKITRMLGGNTDCTFVSFDLNASKTRI